jgi:drug/metabolite transporter (DMT)-like permease
MTPASVHQKRLAYVAWVAVCLIWGTTYLGIRISLESIPPALMGGMRWTFAGALVVLYLRFRGKPLPPASRWKSSARLGFLLLGLGNGGVVFAEQWVPSGLAAVLVASSPFWMAGVEAFMPDGERLRPSVVLGLLIGFTGILIVAWPELTLGSAASRGFLVGLLALQVASFGWSLGSSYSRRHTRNDHVLGSTAYQMIAGGVMMLVAGTLAGEWERLFFTGRTTAALAYLTTVGAIGGFVAYSYALRHLPVSFVSLYAYVNPIIAVALGVLLLAEPFTRRTAIAATLVFVGVAVVQWRRGTPQKERSAADLDDQRRVA